MHTFNGKGLISMGIGRGGTVGGLVSALGLKALAIFTAGFLLVGGIGSWWFLGDLAVMDHGIYGHILIVVGVDLPQNGKKGAVYLA